MELWSGMSDEELQAHWRWWYSWAVRSRLEPIKQVARMLKAHLQGVFTAIRTGTTNAISESMNSKIQWIKRMACGFRNLERFRNAIYFHLGGLDMRPAAVTHTKA